MSASLAGLSVRQRAMRGKRTAMPDLCRVRAGDALEVQLEHLLGSTARTGPNRSMRVRAHPGVELADLLVGEARVRLGHRHQLALVPDREGVVGEEVRPPAVPRVRVEQHRVDAVKGSIFHFHQSPRLPPVR